MTSEGGQMTRTYAFDNSSAQAVAHHDALSGLLDAETRRRIGQLVDLPGRRCLEVGAGAGSIALWLAESGAEVLATDLKPQHVPEHPRLTVLRHDITEGSPPGMFDLAHARLVLSHLPGREVALRHMLGALRPGGVVLTEDFRPTPGEELVVAGPDPQAATLVGRIQTTLSAILVTRGNDRNWSRRAIRSFLAAGLTDVRVRVHGGTWRGGDPGLRLLLAIVGQLHDEFRAHGLSERELARAGELLLDPRLVVNGHLTYQTSGVKVQVDQGTSTRSTATSA